MNQTLGAAFTVHAMTHERAHHLHPDCSCAEIILSTAGEPSDQAAPGWRESLRIDCPTSDDEASVRRNAVIVAQALSRWRHHGVIDVVVHCEDGCHRAGPIVSAVATAGFGRSRFWERCRNGSRDNFCEAVSKELSGLLRRADAALH